jgi:hypothetical protein
MSNSSLQLTRKGHSSRDTAVCQNHDSKVAKYIVYSDDETLPYCEKCAILLASQGFKVARMEVEPIGEGEGDNPLDLLENHPRKTEITKFISELERMTEHLNRQKGESQLNLQRIDQDFEEQKERVDSYYHHLIEILEIHRESVIEDLEMSRAEAQA